MTGADISRMTRGDARFLYDSGATCLRRDGVCVEVYYSAKAGGVMFSFCHPGSGKPRRLRKLAQGRGVRVSETSHGNSSV